MKRRFTDADKFDDEWYLSLTNDNRIIWEWILAKCSNAGILKKNFKALNFQCNLDGDKALDEPKFLELFNGRITDLGKVYFIPKFLKFQNPQGLKSNKPMVQGIINELLTYDISIIKQSLPNDYLIIEGKGKGKGIVKGKRKEKEIIPTVEEFLDYAKTLKEFNYSELEFALKAKYQAWVDAGWKDGHGSEIKIWKTKLQNTITHLRAIKASNGEHKRVITTFRNG